MALDEPRDTDNVYHVNGFQFIIDKNFDEKVKPVKVDYLGYGFRLTSNVDFGASCASSGSCNTCCG